MLVMLLMLLRLLLLLLLRLMVVVVVVLLWLLLLLPSDRYLIDEVAATATPSTDTVLLNGRTSGRAVVAAYGRLRQPVCRQQPVCLCHHRRPLRRRV
jgi:hypothetical protein